VIPVEVGVLRKIWDERPVGVKRFVTDPEYLGLTEGVYPEILRTLSAIFRGKHEEAVLCWEIGSGKSYLCSLALLYMLYRTLCLHNPQRYYQLGDGSQIAIVNVGPTARVAEKVIFGEVRELVRRSPWFVEKYPADARVRKELHFPKNVAVIPGNSSELFPLGLNVLAATMDEASFFVETHDGQREAAEEVYLALQRRVKSRFGDKGLMMIASSPRHSEDFIMKKLAEAESTPTVYGSRKATWEVKPKSRFGKDRFKYKGMEIPAEFQREFDKNAEKALRDLAARPGAAYAPFFVDMGGLEEACRPSATEDGNHGTISPHPQPLSLGRPRERGERRETASYPQPLPKGRGERRETTDDGRLRHPFEGDGRLAEWFRTRDGAARFVHVDLGLKKDACGIAMAKVETNPAGMPVVVVEMMNQIKAPPGGEVDFAGVRELILSLRGRGFPIARVTYDGWQSADSLQILRRKGIEAGVVPVALPEYETLKELANDRRLRMYEFRPFVEECKRLEMIRGNRVDHPPGGSKDVADAVAGAVSEALKEWRGEEGVRGRIV
jgi:hypothetical protein